MSDTNKPTERKIVCDGCGMKWEESFFCPDCSGWHREEHETPNLMWDGYPSEDEMEMTMRDIYKDICFNCCSRHEMQRIESEKL